MTKSRMTILIAAIVLLCAVVPALASAQAGSGTPAAAGASAGGQGASQQARPGTSVPTMNPVDLNGMWFYMGTQPQVTGICPPGGPSVGKLVIKQSGQALTLDYISGAVCNPGSVCHYSGSVSGSRISLSNVAAADDEGGKVTNTLELAVSASDYITGKSRSRYAHPEGMSCSWQSDVEISRVQSKLPGVSRQGETGRQSPHQGPATDGNTAEGGSGGQSGSRGQSGGQVSDQGGTGGEGGNQGGSTDSTP